MNPITILAAMLLTGAAAAAPVSEQQSWTETYPVASASPRLDVSNIWGSVQVRAGKPGQITVAVTELRSAPDQAGFDRSRDIIRLDIDADASGVSLVVGDRRDRWRRWNECHGCRVDYQFDIDVPPGASIDVGTVMDGRIDVQGVAGTVSASNVNGPVRVTDARDCDAIKSVNGPITLGFSRAPRRDCRIETINGNVTLEVQDGTGLDMALGLFNGDVSSDLQVAAFELPATIEKSAADGVNRYRILKLAGVRLGAGGPRYSIASMNGDLRIRKRR